MKGSYSLPVVAAAALWGTTGTAQALAPAGVQPLAVGAVRIALGGAALVLLAVLLGSLSSGKAVGGKARGGWSFGAVAAAAVGVAFYQPLFFAGVATAGVSVGTVVAIGSAPVMAGIVGFLALGERPGGGWAIATALAVAGCVLLVGGGSEEVEVAGILYALGSGLCYGTYATASKVLLDRGLPHSAVMAAAFGIGGALLAPALLFVDLGWLAEPGGLAAALHLGLVATAAAYLLFARGLSGLPVSTTATLSLAEPLTAGLLGLALLGERLGLAAIFGAGLLLCGLVLASRRDED